MNEPIYRLEWSEEFEGMDYFERHRPTIFMNMELSGYYYGAVRYSSVRNIDVYQIDGHLFRLNV